MAFVFFWDYFLWLESLKQICPSNNRTSWIVLIIYLDGSFWDTNWIMPLLSLIALSGFSTYLGWSHTPCPQVPLVVWPPPTSCSLLTRCPSWLGLTPAARWQVSGWDIHCPTSVSAWASPFLRMPFPFFTWHPVIHPLRFLSGKSSCSTRHIECLSSGLTLYITISQSQGFPDWTVIIDYLSAPTTT